MSRARRLAVALSLITVAATTPAALAASTSPTPAFTTTPLTFTVHVGPDGGTTCTILGDLRVPAGVTKSRPAPGAVLATNGFGGSKSSTGPNGNGSYGARFAEQGYVTLSYSGLGFGGSSCSIYIDDPDYDGKAGSQLISFLGGARGIAATSDGRPFDVAGLVRLDRKGSDGKAHPNDPRVAMIGGSYGGQAQFTIARVDPRLDAIAPVYTWNDLGYSLAPNNAGAVSPTAVTSTTPGIWKSGWHSLFFGLGVAGPAAYPGNTPSSCGGYPQWVCQAYAELSTTGYPSAATQQHIRQISVGPDIGRIRIPVLLSQGQQDSLFNLHEASATFAQLQAQGTPVRMLWQSWGHTVGTPVAGELNTGTLDPGTADLRDTYQGRIYTDWMAHWLKDAPTDLGPALRYFRDWAYRAPANPSDKAAAYAAASGAYASAARVPVGRSTSLLLSGGSDLVRKGVRNGSATFLETGGTPAGTAEAVTGGGVPQQDARGTTAAWTTQPLGAPLDVAGIPVLSVRFDAPQIAAAQAAGPAGQLQLFARLYDVAPDGTRTLVRNLVSAVRVPDVTKPVRITLPGIVHEFGAGHRVQLVLAASDAVYKGAGVTGPVTVHDSAAQPNVLTLPSTSGPPRLP
jgi:ABC-2 type transport system ATP-binding protein